MKIYKTIIVFLTACFLLTSCFEDNDDNAISASSINDFVWKSLNTWYFWQQDVPDLADDRFSSNEEYADFLNSFDSPEDLFEHLKFGEDRFSWIVDDYFELLNSFDGISKTNGMEFGLAQVSGSNDLIGFVEYILPNTDAQAKGLKRGDLFLSVNGSQITLDNYIDLLFSDTDTYTINIAEYDGATVQPTDIDITLNKEPYSENPIFIEKTFEFEGKKIGYLMYTQFINDFDDELNNAFANFKSSGIDELVVDLRYNLGGSSASAVHLSTMITGQFTGDLFYTRVWNDKILADVSPDDLRVNFPNALPGGASINGLNLNKVYILAQGSSASASELVINSLNPYIEVIHIGNTTRGKNEFSRTLFDVPQCSYVLSAACNDDPNPSHTWAIQPLLGRNANADGFFDFTDGLTPEPNFIVQENIFNLGVLGNLDEPLLARALQHSSGNGKSVNTKTTFDNFKIITHSKLYKPNGDKMYINEIPQEIIDVMYQ